MAAKSKPKDAGTKSAKPKAAAKPKKATTKKSAPKRAAKLPAPRKAEPTPGVEDFDIRLVDGARAVLKLGKEERLVDQADLHRVQKQVARGIQGTY